MSKTDMNDKHELISGLKDKARLPLVIRTQSGSENGEVFYLPYVEFMNFEDYGD